MPILEDYSAFEGDYWQTACVRNALAHQGVIAPHTGEPLTEALLNGINGGAVFGYFAFAYEGFDPHVALLTRNTFDMWDKPLERLSISQDVKRTGSPEKGVQNLLDALENGQAAIVWADVYSLSYNALGRSDDWWEMMPVLVYGYDDSNNTVHIADRARVPLTITTDELAQARARVKKDKFQVVTLDSPDLNRLPAAVQRGLEDCIRLYTEKPPRGSASNFGFKGYEKWIKLLTKSSGKQSWAQIFPPGRAMFNGLITAYTQAVWFGKDGQGAERLQFAAFLDEATLILDRPDLKEVAKLMRVCAEAWDDLSKALLPDDVPVLAEVRALIDRRYRLFKDHGQAEMDAIRECVQQIDTYKTQMETDFPLDSAGAEQLRESIAEHVARLRDLESAAIEQLQTVMLATS